jgi:hypothetical protein
MKLAGETPGRISISEEVQYHPPIVSGLTHLNFLARYFVEHFRFDIKIIIIKIRLPICRDSNGQARVFKLSHLEYSDTSFCTCVFSPLASWPLD